MARFFTDFSEYPTGPDSPSDWIRRGNDTAVSYAISESMDAIGGKYLQRTGGGSLNDNRSLSWSKVGVVSESEVLMRCRTNTTASGLPAMAILRLADDGMTGYAGGIGIVGTSTRSIRIDRISSSGNSVLGSVPFAWESNVWYWVRMRASGASLMVKAWAGDIADEPAEWAVTATNSMHSSGRVGCFARRPDTHDWDLFGVGTDGSKAPASASRTAAARRRLQAHRDMQRGGSWL